MPCGMANSWIVGCLMISSLDINQDYSLIDFLSEDLLRATSCGLYFTLAANFAKACSSFGGEP